jgi:uncharacterized protein
MLKIKVPWWQFNGHVQTVWPSTFRKIKLSIKRERLELEDGDFLDVDWHRQGSEKLIICTHGLEGDSTRHYVVGAAKVMVESGFDALIWNCRSCSGEINRLPRFYHHGDASDLKAIVDLALSHKYREIYLLGFSMGGSLTLRYLAENASNLSFTIKKALAVSVPLDLVSSVKELDKKGKRFYQTRFLRKLKVKLEKKERLFPGHPIINTQDYNAKIRNFEDFDNYFTAPLHNYSNAQTFYKEASVKPLLGKISVPVDIIQALNDPFMTPECLEIDQFNDNLNLNLILTDKGGHVGFMQANNKLSFIEQHIVNAWTKGI